MAPASIAYTRPAPARAAPTARTPVPVPMSRTTSPDRAIRGLPAHLVEDARSMQADDGGRDLHPVLLAGHPSPELAEGVPERRGPGEGVQDPQPARAAVDGLVVPDHPNDVIRPDLRSEVPGTTEHGRRGQADPFIPPPR